MFPVIRHALSHGLSVLICIISSALIIELMKPLLPNYIAGLSKLSTRVVSVLHLSMTIENMNILLLATIPAIIWGIFFNLRLNRSEDFNISFGLI